MPARPTPRRAPPRAPPRLSPRPGRRPGSARRRTLPCPSWTGPGAPPSAAGSTCTPSGWPAWSRTRRSSSAVPVRCSPSGTTPWTGSRSCPACCSPSGASPRCRPGLPSAWIPCWAWTDPGPHRPPGLTGLPAGGPGAGAHGRSGGLCACGIPEVEFGHGHLAHLVLLHLAGDGHRELAGEPQVTRDLVVRDLAGAELAHLLQGQRLARAQLHPGAQLLAVLGVGHPDHLHVLDGGVRVEELLDLARVDVLAAPDHHVLDPPGDVQVARVVHDGEVAGVHPARRVDGVPGLLLVVPVAEHHRVTPGAPGPRWTPAAPCRRPPGSGWTPGRSPSSRSRWSPPPCASR